MAIDYKHRAQNTTKPTGTYRQQLISSKKIDASKWMQITALVILSAGFLVYLRNTEEKQTPFLTTETQTPPENKQALEAISEPERPKFDFYKLLSQKNDG